MTTRPFSVLIQTPNLSLLSINHRPYRIHTTSNLLCATTTNIEFLEDHWPHFSSSNLGVLVHQSTMGPSSTLQWLSLVGIIWLQAINGTNTDFAAYSSQLKDMLSMSQVQINNLAFASDAGKLFGWVSGLATVYLPLWAVLIIGAGLGLVGYGVQFLFLVNRVSCLKSGHIFFLTVLAGNSICWINTVCYAVSIKNFPYNQVITVGLSTSYVGLSAKLYTDIVNAVSGDTPNGRARDYFFLNSVLPLAVVLLTAPLFRHIEVKKTKGLEMGFVVMFIITGMTGLYAVFTSLELSRFHSPLVHVIGLGTLLAMPLLIPLATKVKDICEETMCRVHTHSVGDEESVDSELKQEDGVEVVRETRVLEEISAKTMVRRVEFWLYFFVYMFGATIGSVYLNNLGQISESRSYSKASSLVSLSSSFGFFGRLMPSILDYFFSKSKYMVSKSTSVAILMAPMAGAFFLLLNTHNTWLYVSTAIIGVCTGAISSIAVSTTTELFGRKNFNVNHNIVIGNIPIGSFTFGYIAAIFYQKQADGQGKCFGFACYRKTFLMWGTICSLGTLLAVILSVRTRRKFNAQSLR